MPRETASKSAIVLNWALNVALVLATLVFAWGIFNRYYGPTHAHEAGPPLEQGMKLTLPDMDWAANKQTLIMALSADCHFCTESGPLYRRLSQGLSGREVKIVALLPQPVDAGRKYLGEMQVRADDVRQMVLPKIGILSTPTLALVDGAGTVTDLWVGKLGLNAEMALLDRLQVTEQADAPSAWGKRTYPAMTAAELQGARAKKQHVVVVDVDPREQFLAEHVPGAMNIPSDELETRAEQELNPEDRIVLYCRCRNDGLSLVALERLVGGGFRNILVLKGGLDAWKQTGAQVETGARLNK